MKTKYHYASVSKALEELKLLGFDRDYNLDEDFIVQNVLDINIVHVYRYEGFTNPDDQAIVYGIEPKNGQKGVFVSGFTPNAITDALRALIDIQIRQRE
ncbi:hypothetical protein [Flavobacterium sp. 14A]|uniref:hypothetical protein n=1 Tax=Flavobacterium sp. 14A TaxID=2735896 RepID=UPI00156F4D28|nr:hypothetical protein [Flavobacterium sp. 14A]NRT10517.1 hypothetical protein [Flavobacterium sp. 14A]